MSSYSADIQTVFHALADPTRLAVVERLCQGDATVTELSEPHDMALPSFLQHLKVLESAGLVSSRKQGRVRTVRAERKTLDQIERWVNENRAYWSGALDNLEEHAKSEKRRKHSEQRRRTKAK